MLIVLDLNEDQWSELYHAVETKQIRVEEGHYGEDEDEWAGRLDAIKDVVSAALDEKGVTY